MVVGAAAAFATLTIFGKLAFASGLGTEQLLAFRFVLGAAGMWGLAFLVGQSPLRLKRDQVVGLLVLGAVLYAGQALTYFIALRSLPASLCVLILYIYPSLVLISGRLFLHRPVSVWRALSLLASFTGVALLVGGTRFQLATELVFAFASPVLFTIFFFVGERVMAAAPPVAATAVMLSGTAAVMCVVAALSGQLTLPATGLQWGLGVAIVIMPTMVAISLFLAGLPRTGAGLAAVLSTVEPVVTLVLAFLVLGDRFTALQAAGAALVLLAVVSVQAAQLRRPAPVE